MPAEEFEARVFAFLTHEERHTIITNGSVDFSYELEGNERFRINVYKQESGISVAARIVPRRIPSFDELHLPPIVQDIADFSDGLVLVSGTTGSGKSTTIAAMLEHINRTRQVHVITIEDPIEFLHIGKKCLINQREIGMNVKDFPTALACSDARRSRCYSDWRNARRRDLPGGDASGRYRASGILHHSRLDCAADHRTGAELVSRR